MRSCKYTYVSFTKICHTIIMLRVIQCSRVSESSTAVSSSPITPTNGTAMTESVAHVHTQDVAYVQELCSIIFNNRLAGNYQQVHGCTMGQGRDRLKYKGAFRISLLYLLSTFFLLPHANITTFCQFSYISPLLWTKIWIPSSYPCLFSP